MEAVVETDYPKDSYRLLSLVCYVQMLLFVSSLFKEIMHYICIDYEEKVHIEMKFLIIDVRLLHFFYICGVFSTS